MKKILKSIKTGWLKFAHVLGVINTTILLSIFYIVFIGIYAIIVGLPKKAFALIKGKPKSYYIDHSNSKEYKYPF